MPQAVSQSDISGVEPLHSSLVAMWPTCDIGSTTTTCGLAQKASSSAVAWAVQHMFQPCRTCSGLHSRMAMASWPCDSSILYQYDRRQATKTPKYQAQYAMITSGGTMMRWQCQRSAPHNLILLLETRSEDPNSANEAQQFTVHLHCGLYKGHTYMHRGKLQ